MIQERDTAKKIIEYLDYGATGLDEKTVAKLQTARQRAVQAAQPTMAGRVELAHAGLGQVVSRFMHGHPIGVAMVAVLITMLMLVVLIQKNTTVAPVDTDTLLLASDLPPEAYVDKGFDAWLQDSSQR
jgi:hypothetical protein